MGYDTHVMISRFVDGYTGMFGKFETDEDPSDISASASSPDGDNVSTIRFDVCDDVSSEFANRKAFIDSKRRRLGPMGKLQSFDHPSGFEESYGGILNFKLLGKSGGFFFYTAHRNDILLFIQAYSTSGRGQIPDEERDAIIDAAFRSMGDA